MDREFKGVWIPKEVWLDNRLNMLDKGILVEIDSLDNEETGCYASNEYLANFCQCSQTKVSTAISKLIELEYIYVKSFDGRQRILKSSLSNFERQNYKNCKADFKNLKENNIIDNNNKINNKKEERKKATSYDDIINSLIADFELREILLEFIKMRKLIKKPMTNYALERLIKKLLSLSANSDERKQILINSITNGWQDIYPIKKEQPIKVDTTNKLNKDYKKQNFNKKYLDGLISDLDNIEI